MDRTSKKIHLISFSLVTVLALFIGIYVGVNNREEIEEVIGISNKENPANLSEVDFSTFWKAWNIIDDKYPGASDIDNQARVYGAISGLLGSLEDPYSVFLDPRETKVFEEEISGNFSGVGMEVDIKEGILTVIAPLKDTPAYRAGIKSGDRIIKIDESLTADLSVEQAVKMIRGEKGTEVKLTILRPGQKSSEEIKITRDIISVPTLETELRDDGVFVIKLFTFSGNSAELFKEALKEFALAQTDKLVLDLRGNPGGYLNTAVYVASWFLPEGKVIVTEDYGGDTEPEVFRSKGYKVLINDKKSVLDDNLKLVILIDGGSASASEIVAGAMQDHQRALLVGTKSFGKGSVQEVVPVTNDTLIKITVAKWLTPEGHLIAETGLTPDYEVEPGTTTDKSIDTQMEAAAKLLNKWPGIK